MEAWQRTSDASEACHYISASQEQHKKDEVQKTIDLYEKSLVAYEALPFQHGASATYIHAHIRIEYDPVVVNIKWRLRLDIDTLTVLLQTRLSTVDEVRVLI